jgi:RNA polymerase sigma factor (sigma-70 family)
VSVLNFFVGAAKVGASTDSNQLVGTYQATILAHGPWGERSASGRPPSRPPSRPPVQVSVPAEKQEWRELYETNYLNARRFLLSLGVPTDAVEDACQDVFLQAFRYLPKFRGDCSFKTWLYRICASEARRYRQRTRLKRALFGLLSAEAEAPVSQGEWGDRKSAVLVSQAVAQLPETERLVFVLYELEGLSGKEISEIAECPEATVWRRLHYARKSFRTYFEKHGEDA